MRRHGSGNRVQFLAAAQAKCRAAAQEKGDVGTQDGCNRMKLRRGQSPAAQRWKRQQHGGGVRRSAAKTTAHWNALIKGDLDRPLQVRRLGHGMRRS
jgi:hypothetical protein